MKIAVDIRPLARPHHSGVDRYTIETITALAQEARSDTFILFASGTKPTLAQLPTFSAPNIKVVQRTIPNRFLYLLLFFHIRTLEDFLPEPVDAWWFPNLNILHTRLPYALTVHDLSFSFAPEFFPRKTRLWHWCVNPKRLFKSAKALVAVSERTKQDIQKIYGIPDEHISVTPLGVMAAFHPHETPSDQTFLRAHRIAFPYFLTLCTREPRKNLRAVLEAYLTYRQERTGSQTPHLVLAGSNGWMTHDLQKRIAASPFAKDIHLLGYVPEQHKPALYRHAAAFFFPSFYEGFGLPVLEAMACGTPVVASFAGAIPEVTSDAAILIDPYHPNEIIQAMEVLEDAETRKKMSLAGIQQSKQFTWNSTAQKTYTILKQLLT